MGFEKHVAPRREVEREERLDILIMAVADPILLALLLAVEEEVARSLPITINIRGFLVSGVMCSRQEYMVEAEAYAAGIVGLNASGAISALHQFIRDAEAVDAAKGERMEHPGEFVHLKNAQFLSSAFYLSNDGVPWRGKLSSVDAWTLGILRP